MADGLLPANSFGHVMRREKNVTHRNNKNVGENRNTDRLRDNKKKKRWLHIEMLKVTTGTLSRVVNFGINYRSYFSQMSLF